MTTADLAPSAVRTRFDDRTSWFRGDVDGLRAVAIVLVVAYHAGLPFSSAGFIGVDMFFVISGFLISRNLLREAESSGGIGLGTFWARRIRRLVPALALMILATLAVSYYVLPGYELDAVTEQGQSAALYVSNIYFARDANDYFASDIGASPFLHTWSLGVEEQFYLLWPVLVAAGYWVARRSSHGARSVRRSSVITLFALTFVASMALNIVLTRSGSVWAFFSLPTRAWEFAAAGLLAAVPLHRSLHSVAARTTVAAAGLLVLLAAGLTIGEDTPYPGLWALLPVVATVLLITAGTPTAEGGDIGPINRLLALPPLQWLGRVSYSWYLWHWPAIVLLVAWRGEDTVSTKTVAAMAALPIGWLAYRFFETPLRFQPALTRSLTRTYAFGAGVTALVLVAGMAVRPDAPPGLDATVDAATLDEAVAALSAPPGSSLQERIDTAIAIYRQRGEQSCPGVGAVETPEGDEYCIGGDPTGTRTLLLLGDSHAGQWRAPLDAIARDRGIRLLIRQANGCPPYAVPVTSADRDDITLICERIAEGNQRVIAALDPDAVLVSSWAGDRDDFIDASGDRLDPAEQEAAWEAGAEDLLSSIVDSGASLGFILDEPTLPENAGQCLSREDDIAACEVAVDDALEISGPIRDAERRVLDRLGDIPTIDAMDLACDEEMCRLEVDGDLTYVDTHHFSDAFAMRQRPLLEEMVSDLLG